MILIVFKSIKSDRKNFETTLLFFYKKTLELTFLIITPNGLIYSNAVIIKFYYRNIAVIMYIHEQKK